MMAFLRERFPELWEYRGRILGTIFGVTVGLIWAFLGFWRALAFIIAVLIGYFLGKYIDRHGSLQEFINQIFSSNR
jgi:uncharacterized membrane protein